MNKFQKKINVEIKKLLKIIENSNLSTIKNFDKLCHLSISAIKKNKKSCAGIINKDVNRAFLLHNL